ncbi:MAG TPA: hypothetical protein VNN77_18155 [candidate division Zixibacteria bacterium]|nr:hypothetical protein [candidate division Zixibacteria bacterium]
MKNRASTRRWLAVLAFFVLGAVSAAQLNVVWTSEVLEENFREHDFPLKPYPSKEYFELPIQEVGKKDPRMLAENPERFVDVSLVKEPEASGFIDRLTAEYVK